MDQVLTAIRAHCEAQGLRPWTLARETGIPLSGWQRILDGAEPLKSAWASGAIPSPARGRLSPFLQFRSQCQRPRRSLLPASLPLGRASHQRQGGRCFQAGDAVDQP